MLDKHIFLFRGDLKLLNFLHDRQKKSVFVYTIVFEHYEFFKKI